MSHFAVAVFSRSDDGSMIEDLLAPYDENISYPHYTPKEKIISDVRKDIESFKGTYERYLKDPDGYISSCSNKDHIRYITEEYPKKLKWTDEECYLYGIRYEDKENIKEDGSVFSKYNPNAKWDWYQIGGRFSDEIPLNDGTFCDESDMSDVNIDFRDEELYKDELRFWQLYIEGAEPVTERDKELIKWPFYRKEYYQERYRSAEEYAEYSSGFNFYAAVLPNGEWLEPGTMGWFAVSSATAEDEIKWHSKVKDILKKAKEENWHITMVDCHI